MSSIHGEAILRLLRSINGLNPLFQIRQEQDNIIIPIQTNIETREIQAKFPIKIAEYEFMAKDTSIKSIVEYLKSIDAKIPSDLIPTAFDQIGEIAVIDLKSEVVEYSNEISEAILSVHPSITTVFRKKGKISGQYRLPELELIGGIDNSTTIHTEYGIKFIIDLRKIYFSPRLSTEHNFIAKQVQKGEMVLDLFAGIGAFGLHITKLSDITVISNDHNPEFPRLFKACLNLNKKLRGKNVILNDDAHDLLKSYQKSVTKFDRIIMNHPSNSLKYVEDAFKVLKKGGTLYLYVFGDEGVDKVKVQTLLKPKISNFSISDLKFVRQSSPREYHIRISLKKA